MQLNKIQAIDKIDGFACGATNDFGTLLYAYPEYLKINIFKWKGELYNKVGKLELGYHMGSKKLQGISVITFMPESEDEFLCIVGKALRKSSLKD